jgi:DNA (cytosine-5)-methyltransferase 1
MEGFANIEFIDEPNLRIGTDCSGIEAPIQALTQLGIPFTHVFSSDIDKFCIQSIKANYKPQILFGDKDGPFPDGDITKRSIEDVPDIDLYVCGFPCQPFSTAGNRNGFEDERGNVFFSCLDVIKVKQPKYFILENVKGLLSHDKENKKDKYGRTWSIIWTRIQELEKYGYKIKYKVMNTRDYGIPQDRSRLYIVGTKKNFRWPEYKPLENILSYVDHTDNITYITSNRHNSILDRINSDQVFIEFAFGVSKTRSYINANKYSCCITASTRLWCIPKHRYANIKELLNLQGFSDNFVQVVCNTRLKKQIGNSMSVNVIRDIIIKLL